MLPAGAQMTLRDCLIYARDHAANNRLERIATEQAKAGRMDALSGILPYMGFNAGGNLSFGRNIDPETNTYDNRRTLSSSFGLSMQLPLFDGLVAVNNLNAARMAVRRQQSAARARQDEISLAVIKAFYQVAYCKALVAQMEEAYGRDSLQLAATSRQVALGTKSEADEAELKALVAADEYELTNQRNLLSKAYLALRAEMGMEASDEPLDLIEDAAQEGENPSQGSDILPRLSEAIYAERESRMGLRAARGAFSPRITFNAGISTSFYRLMGDGANYPSFSRQWHDNMGQYLGVSFSFTIFDGLSNVARLKRARLSHAESRERLAKTRLELDRQAAEARLDWTSSREEWSAARARLDAEQKAYAAVSRKYEHGAASAIDLYTSSAKLSTARATLEGKRIQMIISRISLDYCNGVPLISE